MQFLTLCFVACLLVHCAVANPIAFDDERRPVAMLSEKVDVAVGQGKSMVSGVFRFQQEPPFESGHRHVTVFVPVLLPSTIRSDQYQARYGLPRVEIHGRKYSAALWNDIHLAGMPEAVPLPRGWYLHFYVCNVPLRGVSETFDARISYVQPHFPKEVSAYVPLRPPQAETASLVTFSAEPGGQLRRVSWLSCLSRSSDALQFTPKDRKLIRVQLLKHP